MKVKDLIKYLKKQNPEYFVGILDYEQDSGDWIPLEADQWDLGDLGNLKILSYEEALKKLNKDGSTYLLQDFKERFRLETEQGGS